MIPRHYGILASAATLFLASSASATTVLFADNFNRASNADVDAEPTGMSGSLGALSYLEVWQGGNPGTGTVLQINGSGQLAKVGTGMGMGGIDHNFVDAAILAAGGFSLAFDVAVGSSGNDLPDRFGGFGVGLSQADVLGFQDENDTNFGPRGSISNDANVVDQGANGRTGVADFYVSLSLQNNVQVFTGGLLQGQFAVTPSITGAGSIETTFTVSDFNAGSSVGYTVKFNGDEVATGTFLWSGTEENYVGFSMRSSGVTLDNLAIATVPEPGSVSLLLAGGAFLLARRRR
jgi:hypothetical protein